jgi:hypothetical protein
MLVSLKRISPDVGLTRPVMELRVVVFPAPLLPMRVTISPLLISMSIPLRAWILP